MQGFNQLRMKKYFFKNSERSKKQNLNLPHPSHYLHSIYILFTTIYKATIFIVLGIISNLEMT